VRNVTGLDPETGTTAAAPEFTAFLAERFATQTAAVWGDMLQAAGIGAHDVVGLAALMQDPRARARELSVTQVSPEVGEVTMPGITIRMSATPPRLGPAVRQPGSDARDVLDLIGLSQELDLLTQRWGIQTAGLPGGWGSDAS
jgi:crotonobetainyl-CoA:carnitine CoA-transferase CaiB-like acyl-CoA transferase